jgi:hypothetical protein
MFLRLIAATMSLQSAVKATPQEGETSTLKLPFPMRVLDDCAAALRCALYTVGDRLGLFRLMAETGSITADELARKAHVNARILREWLNAMAAADYIEYSPAGKTYLLTKEHALVLADEETSAVFLGGMFEFAEALVAAAPAFDNCASHGQTSATVRLSCPAFGGDGTDLGAALQTRLGSETDSAHAAG